MICTSRFLSKRNVSLFRLLESNELRLFETPACNKSKNCSVPASEETTGWKAGVSVGYCANCSKVASAKSEEKAKGTKEKTAKARGTKEENHSTRKCLTLCQKVEVIRTFQNRRESTRKLAKRFECGKTQIIKILKNKESILEA